MKKEEKQKVLKSWQVQSNLNKAKDLIYVALEYLVDNGMYDEPRQLMSMIYKIERLQNKYR